MTPSSTQILATAASAYGLKPREMLGRRCVQTHIRARWLAILLFREFRPGLPKARIARALGRERTTVRHALKRADAALVSEPEFAARVTVAVARLQSLSCAGVSREAPHPCLP